MIRYLEVTHIDKKGRLRVLYVVRSKEKKCSNIGYLP